MTTIFEFFLRVLAQLDHPAALQQLVAYTLDPEVNPEIRAQAATTCSAGRGPCRSSRTSTP